MERHTHDEKNSQILLRPCLTTVGQCTSGPVKSSSLFFHRTGICSGATPPALSPDGGTVYVGYGNDVVAVNTVNGLQRWSYTTDGKIGSSPALSHDGGTVYVGCHDKKLHVVNTANGQFQWSLTTGDRVLSSPALSRDGGTVFFGSNDKNLYAITTAYGELSRWSYGVDDDNIVPSSPEEVTLASVGE